MVPPTILPAITAILTILIGAFATRLNFTITPENLAILATSIAMLTVEYLKWRDSKEKTTRIEKVETLAPSLTQTKSGNEVKVVVVDNDPTTPLPPIITETYTKSSP